MVNALALNQCAGKNNTKFCRTPAWLEALYVHPAGQIKEFFLRETACAEGVSRRLRQNEQEISEFILFNETIPLEQESGFPFLKTRLLAGGCGNFRPLHFLFAAIAVPGWDLNDRRDAESFCYSQRAKTVARPAMKQIVALGRQVPGRDPVKILFFRAVVMGPIEKRDEAHRMPAQRVNQ